LAFTTYIVEITSIYDARIEEENKIKQNRTNYAGNGSKKEKIDEVRKEERKNE
jgi:hypothetical protein